MPIYVAMTCNNRFLVKVQVNLYRKMQMTYIDRLYQANAIRNVVYDDTPCFQLKLLVSSKK